MNDSPNAIDIMGLSHLYKDRIAVNRLNLIVPKGRCYGFFGPNGAGKTTTIKCLLNHIQRTSGKVSVFGLDPSKDEVGVKSRLGYMPEHSDFYPWMTARAVLDYTATFYPAWNLEIEQDLIKRLQLDDSIKVSAMSKGMKSKLSLICAIAPDPDLLILDEPTSGLDPIVRQELVKTVIGAYQERDPENHTIFVSTHMLHEFEGLVDEFTILYEGKNVLSTETETARKKYKKIRLRFSQEPPGIEEKGILNVERSGRDMEIITSNYSEDLVSRLKALSPETLDVETLSLEEIFIAVAQKGGVVS